MKFRIADQKHLTDVELAAFLDGNIAAGQAEQMKLHLATCDECRGLLVESRNALDIVPQRLRTRVVKWGAPIAAIAAVGLVALVPLQRISERSASMAPADGQREGSATVVSIRTILPLPVASADSIRFVWRADSESSYRLTLTDESGGPLWEATTSDTSVTLPVTVSIEPGARYYWYVDGLRLDGTSVTSGTRTFTVAPR